MNNTLIFTRNQVKCDIFLGKKDCIVLRPTERIYEV